MLRRALLALSAPKHVRAVEGAGAYDWEKPTPKKLGHAFIEYVENYPADRLPTMGGAAATIIVTVPAPTPAIPAGGRGVRSASDEPRDPRTGPRPGPDGRPRRHLTGSRCASRGIARSPAALTRPSLAHAARSCLATGCSLEQKTCQHPSCDTLGALCHVHHTHPWGHDGHTNTTDAVLLCPFHHHQAHTQAIDYPLRT